MPILGRTISLPNIGSKVFVGREEDSTSVFIGLLNKHNEVTKIRISAAAEAALIELLTTKPTGPLEAFTYPIKEEYTWVVNNGDKA